MNTVITKTFTSPPVNMAEILRYASAGNLSANTSELVESCLKECEDSFTYSVCYAKFNLSLYEDYADMTFMKSESKSLLKNLSGCHSVILFGATVGLSIDRLISKYSRISPSRALVFQAIGAERIESLCDAFNKYINDEFGYTKPRFSPGYGDFSIEAQKDFFRILDPGRKIGLTLNESLVMSPTKSVTAVIGLCDDEQIKKESCNNCTKTDCSFRRKL